MAFAVWCGVKQNRLTSLLTNLVKLPCFVWTLPWEGNLRFLLHHLTGQECDCLTSQDRILFLPLWVWNGLNMWEPPVEKTHHVFSTFRQRHIYAAKAATLATALQKRQDTASDGEIWWDMVKHRCGHLWVIQAQPSCQPPLGQLPSLDHQVGSTRWICKVKMIGSCWIWLQLQSVAICLHLYTYQFFRLVVQSSVLPLAYAYFVSITCFKAWLEDEANIYVYVCMHVYTYIGVSINGGSPKWLIYNGNLYQNRWFRSAPFQKTSIHPSIQT